MSRNNKKSQKHLVAFIACLFLAALAPAFGLEVIVLDPAGVPVEGATVVLPADGLEDYSDARGRVVFDNLPDRERTLIIVMPGFDKFTTTLAAGTRTSTARLKSATVVQAAEITISERRDRGQAATRTTVTQENLETSLQNIMNDAVRSLQTMPGVSSGGGTFDSALYIQGGSGYEWLAKVDGVIIANPTRWGGRISMLNPNWIDSIDLYTAGYPARFSQGLSGILDVRVKDGSKAFSILELATSTTEAIISQPLSDQTSIFFSMRRTFYDYFAPLFLPEDQRAGVVFPFLWDGMFKVSHRPTAADEFTFLAYGSWDGMTWNLENDGDTGQPENSGTFHYNTISTIAALGYIHRFAEKTWIESHLAWTPDFIDNRLWGNPVTMLDIGVVQHGFQLTTDFQSTPVDWLSLYAGAAGFVWIISGHANTSFTYVQEDGSETTETSYDTFTTDPIGILAGQLTADITLLPGFIVQAGMVAQHYNKTSELQLEPRGGLKWELTRELDWFLRGGLYSNFPLNVQMLDPDTGNPNLHSVKSTHAITGLDFGTDDWSVRTEGFYKFYWDLIKQDVAQNYANLGERHVGGFDLYLQKKAKKTDWLSGWISYTFAWGIERVTGRSAATAQESYLEPTDTWHQPDYLRSHSLAAIVNMVWRKGPQPGPLDWLEDFGCTIDFRYQSGLPYTPVVNATKWVHPTSGTSYINEYGSYLGEYTPDIFKLDIRLTFPGSPFELLKLLGIKVKSSSFVSLTNVFNAQNVISYFFGVDSDAAAGVTSGNLVGSNAITRTAQADFGFMVFGGFRAEF